jgi:hypothetical protein
LQSPDASVERSERPVIELNRSIDQNIAIDRNGSDFALRPFVAIVVVPEGAGLA